MRTNENKILFYWIASTIGVQSEMSVVYNSNTRKLFDSFTLDYNAVCAR